MVVIGGLVVVRVNPSAPSTRGRFWSGMFELSRHVGIVLLGVLVYFRVRGLTEGSFETASAHGLDVLALEDRLGIDHERWAQDLIIDHSWLVALANWVYIWGHWPVIIVTLGWLYAYHRYEFLLLRNAMFISGIIGLVIFATYAVAPPRLLDVGLVDTVTEHSNAYRWLQPPDLVNKYAAIPSLHLGWNLLVGIILYRTSRSRLVRVFAVASPILMAVAIVVTGNHYVVDGVLGCLLALFGLAVSALVTPRLVELDLRLRQRLHERRIVDDQPVDPPADQLPGGALVGDRPGEDQPVTSLELGDELGGEQPTVQHDPVEGDPGREVAQQDELEAVARRAEQPGGEGAGGPAEQPPGLGREGE